ncbi:MAG: helix-turn-helix transcriptional regulator [Pseudomonadota bacterium]
MSGVCKEHTGQANGFAFPVIGIGMRRGCASIGLDGSPDDFSPGEIMILRHVVSQAYVRIDQLLGPFAPDDVGEPLTPREIDVLRRIAYGMTTAEAAGDLGIGAETAREYLARAKRKTGTRRTPHTVMVAITNGLMVP